MTLATSTIQEALAKGPYDQLYAASGILWTGRPGRMVRLAAKLIPPGRGLDLGCGDGKNLCHLERMGWTIDGIDISTAALRALSRRRRQDGYGGVSGRIRCCDVADATVKNAHYDLVIAYGLYHCLDDQQLKRTHQMIRRAVKPGGLFAFAAFNDCLPVPANHLTAGIQLRPADHIFAILPDWRVIEKERGVIDEHHLPLVEMHQHALTWALFERPV